MPELPEVETTLRGIEPYISLQIITKIIIRHPKLRWDIPPMLKEVAEGQTLRKLTRRGKYILFQLDTGTMLLHLGMSGRLHVLSENVPAQKHDHVDIHFGNGYYLRFTDPRRFGALLWTNEDPEKHPLIASIGPEPLTAAFNGDYLWQRAQKRRVCVKTFIMNGQIVAGVGNIYAVEALFEAGIHPLKEAGKVSRNEFKRLVEAIKTILKKAIHQGGTTLRDFRKTDGTPGYFAIELKVYGRGGQPCVKCKRKLTMTREGQRSLVFCRHCQT